MSKSIFGLNVRFPIIIGAILIRNAENPIKIGKVFMKKMANYPTNCKGPVSSVPTHGFSLNLRYQ